MNRLFFLFVVLIFVGLVADARLKPMSEKECTNLSACILVGKFVEIQDIKIRNRETKPFASAVGTFKVIRNIKASDPSCSSSDSVEVVFSKGRSTTGASWEGTVWVPEIGKTYKVYLISRGVLIPSACVKWIEEVK